MGAASTPVFVVVLNGVLLLLVAIPVAVLIQVVWGGSWSSAMVQGMIVSFLLMSGSSAGLVWIWWRRRKSRLIDLRAFWLSSRHSGLVVGEKARWLNHLSRLGFPVAPGWIVPPGMLGKTDRAAGQIVRAARRLGIRRLIVRSSFPDEDAEHLFPGVFQSLSDVDAADAKAVQRAIDKVMASRKEGVVSRYRDRVGLAEPEHDDGCVLVQACVSADVTGVLCSFHPERRRPDEVTVEAGRPGEARHVDVYSQILGRWLSKRAPLDNGCRRTLLDALRVGERVLRGPVIIEFGVADARVVLFQLRKAPRTSMKHVWSQTGPVSLNPEPLPRLFADVIYGENLSVLRRYMVESLSELKAKDAKPPDVMLTLYRNRPLIEYGSVGLCTRHCPRRHGPVGLVWWLHRRARRALQEARNATAESNGDSSPNSIGRLALLQSRTQNASEGLRSFAAHLSAAIEGKKEFAPFVPWHRWVKAWSIGFARKLERLRNRMHRTLETRLAGLAPRNWPVEGSGADSFDDARIGPNAGGAADWRHLDLDDWLKVSGGSVPRVSMTRLQQRAEEYSEAAKAVVPVVLVSEAGDTENLEEAVPWPPPLTDRSAVQPMAEGGRLSLRPLVPGKASGRVVAADGDEPCAGNVVVVPDGSLRWLSRVMEADAVLLVGGAQLLSHLSLMLLELGIPTLAGLTPDEAHNLVGRHAEVSLDELVLVQTSAT
jgi:hypothetical protein